MAILAMPRIDGLQVIILCVEAEEDLSSFKSATADPPRRASFHKNVPRVARYRMSREDLQARSFCLGGSICSTAGA